MTEAKNQNELADLGDRRLTQPEFEKLEREFKADLEGLQGDRTFAPFL